MPRTAARRTTRRYAVTGVLADNAARTSFTAVPGLTLTAAEVKVGLLGGKNGRGETVPGGWADFVCNDCGERAHWCPDLRALLPAAFVAARQAEDVAA